MEKSKKKVILIIAANPKDTTRLRLDEEERVIKEGLKRANKRNHYQIESIHAARSNDVHRALLDFNPTIIHYCGHSDGSNGIAFENEQGNTQFASTTALAELMRLFSDNIRCIVLNSCYSEVQANAISEHIPYVVGMNNAISDKAAIKFSIGFYDAIGAGRSIKFAYGLGCSSISMSGSLEHITPVLKEKKDFTPKENITMNKEDINTTRGTQSDIELLRIERRNFWTAQNIMRCIFVYPYTDSNFKAALRIAADRVDESTLAFKRDQKYLKLVLKKIDNNSTLQNIYFLLGALNFRGN